MTHARRTRSAGAEITLKKCGAAAARQMPGYEEPTKSTDMQRRKVSRVRCNKL